MSDNEKLMQFIQKYYGEESFEKRPLMYGGDLNGIECTWHVVMSFKSFAANKHEIVDRIRNAYGKISDKYHCGSWTIATKLDKEMGCTHESATELIKRLKEVDEMWLKLEEEKSNG